MPASRAGVGRPSPTRSVSVVRPCIRSTTGGVDDVRAVQPQRSGLGGVGPGGGARTGGRRDPARTPAGGRVAERGARLVESACGSWLDGRGGPRTAGSQRRFAGVDGVSSTTTPRPLRSIGIDLRAVRDSVDRTFGAAPSTTRCESPAGAGVVADTSRSPSRPRRCLSWHCEKRWRTRTARSAASTSCSASCAAVTSSRSA